MQKQHERYQRLPVIHYYRNDSKDNTDNSWDLKHTTFKTSWWKDLSVGTTLDILWLSKPHGITPHVIPCVAKLEPVHARAISQQPRFPH